MTTTPATVALRPCTIAVSTLARLPGLLININGYATFGALHETVRYALDAAGFEHPRARMVVDVTGPVHAHSPGLADEIVRAIMCT